MFLKNVPYRPLDIFMFFGLFVWHFLSISFSLKIPIITITFPINATFENIFHF